MELLIRLHGFCGEENLIRYNWKAFCLYETESSISNWICFMV